MLVDIFTTRALGGRQGRVGIIAYKPTSTSAAPTKQEHGVFLAFLGDKPMWIRSTTEIFDDHVSTLTSLGAMVQVRLTKQAFEN